MTVGMLLQLLLIGFEIVLRQERVRVLADVTETAAVNLNAAPARTAWRSAAALKHHHAPTVDPPPHTPLALTPVASTGTVTSTAAAAAAVAPDEYCQQQLGAGTARPETV